MHIAPPRSRVLIHVALLALGVACGGTEAPATTGARDRALEGPAAAAAPAPAPAGPAQTGAGELDGGVAADATAAAEVSKILPPASIAPPTRETAGAEQCVVEGAEVVGSHAGRLQSLALAYGSGGGLVVWSSDAEHVGVVPIDDRGRASGPARTEELPLGHRVIGAFAQGDRFIVLTHAVCPDRDGAPGRLWACVFARAFGRDGAPLGPALRELTVDTVEFTWSEAAPEALRLYWHHYYGGAALQEYRVDGAGQLAARSLYKSSGGHRRPCGWDGERFVELLYPVDEDPYGGTNVYTVERSGEAEVPLVGFDPNGPVACASAAGELRLISRNGESRPRFFRVGADGHLVDRPLVLRRGDPLPEPFAETLVARTQDPRRWGASARVELYRFDAAGERIGAVARVATPSPSARDVTPRDVAWTGERFLVAYGDYREGAWRVTVSPVSCASPPSAPGE